MQLDDAAVAQLKQLLAEESEPDLALRVFVQGGGCSGMQYGFQFDSERNDDDFELEYPGVRVIVDSLSMQYLQGSTIRYVENAMGSNFTISNPNAATTCGCGSSFSPS